jgi:hypothetical protein
MGATRCSVHHDFPAIPNHLSAPDAGDLASGSPRKVGLPDLDPHLLNPEKDIVRHTLVRFELPGIFFGDLGSVKMGKLAGFFR